MLNEHVARRGLMFVLSSPSGAGKSTLARKLLEADENMSLSVSATTRAPRPSEVDGREYKFLAKTQFEEMADRNEFLEHAMVFGHHYGTPRAPVEAMLIQGARSGVLAALVEGHRSADPQRAGTCRHLRRERHDHPHDS
jgi:guanylate kinase